MYGAQVEGGPPHPVGQGGAVERQTLTGVDLGLPVERKMVGVFGHEHLSDGAVRGQPALDQPGRRGGLHHPILTGAAGVLGPTDHQKPDLGRHNVEALGHVLTDPMQRSRAAGAHRALDIHDGLNPRQVGGQRTPVHPTPGGAGRLLGRCALLGLGVPGRLDLLGFFQSQQELIFGQTLGAAAEAVTLQGLDDLAQPLALGALLQEHRLQQARVVGKPGSRGGHIQMRSDLPATYHHFGARGRAFLLSLERPAP